jgi:hypothetical protein
LRRLSPESTIAQPEIIENAEAPLWPIVREAVEAREA